MFCAEIWKLLEFFYLKNFQFLEVKFSLHLNRHVFIMDISGLKSLMYKCTDGRTDKPKEIYPPNSFFFFFVCFFLARKYWYFLYFIIVEAFLMSTYNIHFCGNKKNIHLILGLGWILHLGTCCPITCRYWGTCYQGIYGMPTVRKYTFEVVSVSLSLAHAGPMHGKNHNI